MKKLDTSGTPPWVWLLCCALAAVEPLTHVCLKYGLPPETPFTGLHIGDDSGFLPALDMFATGFFSPYVISNATASPRDPAWFAAPVFWLLALLGTPGRVLGIDRFLWLGALNGAGIFLYLWAVYRFLIAAAPRCARLAFLLFALGGGIGGMLYLCTGLLGLHDAAWFETFFHRYARYELIEGPFLAPVLLSQRLYYTLPLALGFAGLTHYVRRADNPRPRTHAVPILLLVLATYWNARLGPLFWVVIACHQAAQTDAQRPRQVALLAAYAVLVLLTVAAVSLQMGLNSATKTATFALLRRSIWIGSFLSAACWLLIAAWPAIRRGLTAMPDIARPIAYAAAGYLALLLPLYAAYQTYWGNWPAGGDASAAVAMSDWALPGACIGFLIGLRRRATPDVDEITPTLVWMTLWGLLLLAAGVAALGQGRYLVLMPERCMVLLGVPLSVLAACGLQQLASGHPRRAYTLGGLCIGCGVVSIAVGAIFFQMPARYTPGRGPFQWLRHEVMTANEAALIDGLTEGVLLAPASEPPLYGDLAVARNARLRTVYGQGTFAIGNRDMETVRDAVVRFFDPSTSENDRKSLVRAWRVDYVFCPEVRPVDPYVPAALSRCDWLEESGRAGAARLFRVRQNAFGAAASP